jgi:hypothetical protein
MHKFFSWLVMFVDSFRQVIQKKSVRGLYILLTGSLFIIKRESGVLIMSKFGSTSFVFILHCLAIYLYNVEMKGT